MTSPSMLPDQVRDQIRSEIEQVDELCDQYAALLLTVAKHVDGRVLAGQAYGFVLRWDDMRDLVVDARRVWADAKADIQSWLKQVDGPLGHR